MLQYIYQKVSHAVAPVMRILRAEKIATTCKRICSFKFRGDTHLFAARKWRIFRFFNNTIARIENINDVDSEFGMLINQLLYKTNKVTYIFVCEKFRQFSTLSIGILSARKLIEHICVRYFCKNYLLQ